MPDDLTGAEEVLRQHQTIGMATSARRPGSWNATAEERAMRAAACDWAVMRWPGCKVMTEVPVGQARIDVLVLTPDQIIGIELKSSADTLTRLPAQLDEYLGCIPEVWLAMAPKWWRAVTSQPIAQSKLELPFRVGRLTYEDGVLRETHPTASGMEMARPAIMNPMVTSGALHLLWRDELLAIAQAHGIKVRSRATVLDVCGQLARSLTGDQIIARVSEAIAARPESKKAP